MNKMSEKFIKICVKIPSFHHDHNKQIDKISLTLARRLHIMVYMYSAI